MRVEDLDLKELLELNPKEGEVRFAGQRAMICDTVAHGLHRKELIETFGERTARGILSRFGYIQGRRMAVALKSKFKWESKEDWQRAGARILALRGFLCWPRTVLTPSAPRAAPGVPPTRPSSNFFWRAGRTIPFVGTFADSSAVT